MKTITIKGTLFYEFEHGMSIDTLDANDLRCFKVLEEAGFNEIYYPLDRSYSEIIEPNAKIRQHIISQAKKLIMETLTNYLEDIEIVDFDFVDYKSSDYVHTAMQGFYVNCLLSEDMLTKYNRELRHKSFDLKEYHFPKAYDYQLNSEMIALLKEKGVYTGKSKLHYDLIGQPNLMFFEAI